ncbi:hypothetical protein AMAG_09496 [Allomyces macrogynus ATCC 38327]|uniref:Uncharacterized protein n=1 Tax=Allomyces macrogynus (strain ATCC 38327) TaxID=578462 RepID=A0A0L0SQ65_ALLM3|nr:hypothetical protein AMAG_09496 [Allomyces macrogynus ATCC 38327]|eukprot:KNE64480.1 hypothetical protein AMAG_09496 [Allomyces macrogynus ATCC 38327]
MAYTLAASDATKFSSGPANQPSLGVLHFLHEASLRDCALMTRDTWRQLLKLAQFLGLKPLALAVNRKLVALLEEQFQELSTMPDTQPEANPRRSLKRRRSTESLIDN